MVRDRWRNRVPRLLVAADGNSGERHMLRQLTAEGLKMDGGGDTNAKGMAGVEHGRKNFIVFLSLNVYT